jgi:hypothetical protein
MRTEVRMVRGGAPGRTRLGWERWARLGGSVHW